MATPHDFNAKTYKTPTDCDVCRKLLWGLTHQGLCCSGCGMNVHKKCFLEAPPCARDSVVRSKLTGQSSSSSLPADKTSSRTNDLDDRASVSSTASSSSAFVNDKRTLSHLLPDFTRQTSTRSHNQLAYVSVTNGGDLADEEELKAADTASSHARTNNQRMKAAPVSRMSANTFMTLATETPVQAQAELISPYTSPPQSPVATQPPLEHRQSYKSSHSRARSADATSALSRIDSKQGNSSLLRELIHTTAAEKSVRQRVPLGSPPLNLLTTMPKNFGRFLNKIGPLAAFQDKLEAIIFWHVPTETLLALSVYTLLCFNPLLVLFVPHVVVCVVVLNNYYRAHAKLDQRSTKRHSPAPSATASDMRPDHINYRKNMQFIQNTMGAYCDVYENVCLLNTHIDWEDERKAVVVLQLTAASAAVLALTYSMIPWSWVALVVGWVAVLSTTSVGRALQIVVMKHVTRHHEDNQSVQLLVARFRLLASRWLTGGTRHVSDQQNVPQIVYVECVENQRKWAGAGFTNSTLKKERGHWSNLMGDVNLAAKETYASAEELVRQGMAVATVDGVEALAVDPASKWRWVPGSKWQLDRAAWKMHFGAVPDSDGWVYHGQKWDGVKQVTDADCATRRRRWLRQAEAVNDDKHLSNSSTHKNKKKS